MIYENPTVLESIVKEENQSTDTVSTKDKTTKKPICYSNIKLEDYPHYSYRPSCQFEDYYHLTFYQVPSQMSPMSTFSETPQVSPYIDCYSEYDMASPDIETTTSETRYFQPAAEARSVSPFSLLDVPYINDFNAYGYQETGLADNSYLMDSITKNNDNTKPTLDFGSMTDDVSFLFDQPQQQQFNDNDFLMQFNQSIQYINPALLHI